MGVDFVGHGEFSLTWPQWRGCFALAHAFGWEPAGTLAPLGYRRSGACTVCRLADYAEVGGFAIS